MKICLINPPQILHKRFGMPFVFQPLGLLYVASVLEKRYPVEIIDTSLDGWGNIKEVGDNYYLLGLTFDEIGEKIKEIKPDIVGISVPFTVNLLSALKVASTVKTINKNIVTILGGAHPTARPLETLLSKYVNFVVIGEGETTILELITILGEYSHTKLKGVQGIGYKDGNNRILTQPREWIQNLDSIPFPARHLLPIEEYFNLMRMKKGAREMYTFNERWTSIITSRGCPFNCNFCSIHTTMGRKFRIRSPENVIEEIKLVVKEYNIKHINFEDDNLTFDRNHAEHIFDLMIENKLNITWSTPNGIRVDNLDEQLIRKMKESGCKRVFVAPESGVQRVVNQIIGKNLDLKKIEQAVILFKKYKIIVDGSFVIGLIGETKKDIWKTIKYALQLKKLGVEALYAHIATPYYGTKLYEEAKQKGLLRKDLNDSLFSTSEPLISTEEWDLSEIWRLQRIANWLINQKIDGKIVYILQIFPGLWQYLKCSKKILNYLLKIPSKLSDWLYCWYPLIKNAFKRIISEITRNLPKPEYLVYEVTDACNSRCLHCQIWNHKPTRDNLSVKEVEKAFSNDFFSNIKVVLLTGGEPVLRNDIKEIIVAIHKAVPQAQITLSTNALLPERVLEVVNYAIANNICINVGISVDAIGEKHDLIRGIKGNFKKVDYLLRELINIKEKHKNKIEVIAVGHTLSNLTAGTLKKVAVYAQWLNIRFSTQLYEEFVYYYNVNKNKDSSVENYQKANNLNLIQAIKKLPPSFHNEILLHALKHKLRFRCNAMRSFFLLKCNGAMSPCLRYSDIDVGNLKFHSAYEIWYSDSANRARKLVKNCHGCSNSWATYWSFEAWFPSFWMIRITLMVKNLFYKLKNLGM